MRREDAVGLSSLGDYEVVVCGGGTAGVVAALAAAREGARTVLIEQHSYLGGSQTGSLVTPYMSNKVEGRWLTGGLFAEILQHIRQHPLYQAPPDADPSWFDPVLLQIVYDEMVRDAGVDVLLETSLVDSVMDGKSVCGVVARSPWGSGVVWCRVTVDCTGDGHVAVLSGARFMKGRESDGANQAMSLRFNMSNVDLFETARFFSGIWRPVSLPHLSVGFHDASESPIADLVWKAVEQGVLAEGDLGYFQFFSIPSNPGQVAFNCPRLAGYNPLDPGLRTLALMEGRQKVKRIALFCRRFIPGFKDSYISMIAPQLGVRESRRIVGDYVLSEEDFTEARKFPDAVARNSYPIDVHDPGGKGTALRYLPQGEYHEIPYRCLLPSGVENLLVAGRCVSSTFTSQAAIRVQANCQAMGEAAGTAAALSAKRLCRPREIDGVELRGILRKRGALL